MRYPIVNAHCVYFRDLTYGFFFKMFSKSLNIKHKILNPIVGVLSGYSYGWQIWRLYELRSEFS